jgi:hydrogenase maturation protease
LTVDFSSVDPIARAILYEGYLLYPYRKTSLKNARPCPFGSLYPKEYSLANGECEPWSMQTECLIRGDEHTVIQGMVRFLHEYGPDGALEREVVLQDCVLGNLNTRTDFTFRGYHGSLHGSADLAIERLSPSVFNLRVRIENVTASDRAGPAMLATHLLLGVRGGRLMSLIDPPEDARELAANCRNRGAWPVLVGDPELCDMMLAAPIILYDFPQIAPESPGNYFDGTEIDELLTLRVQTLTDAEKQAMRQDERTRAILERTENLAEDQLRAMHGTIRTSPIAKRHYAPRDRVRLRPRGRADILDLALDGRSATIASVEQDFEGRILYTVTLDDDPGQDLGKDGKPGHRFFFRGEELEAKPSILIAGVGNLFHGDDAFGSEVARQLATMPMPPEVRVVDFGIRGHDLAFALQDGYADVILVDTCQRGARPGTVSVIEPDCRLALRERAPFRGGKGDNLDTHAMDPLRVLRHIRANGGTLPHIWLVACEPLTFGPEEGQMGLSEPVAAAIPDAVALVQSLLKRLCP